MDAGSGAKNCINPTTINLVRQSITVPLMIGGGIVSTQQLSDAYQAGADIVVVGNLFEKDPALISSFLATAESHKKGR